MKIVGVELSKKLSTPSIIAKKISHGPNNADIAFQSDKRHISSVKPEKVSQFSCTGVLDLLPRQEGRASSMTPKKASQTPDTSFRAFKSGPEGSIHSLVHTTDDGYNWRKYGQKNVKGNEYIRSYYKCTHPNCQVKRQLERSHDGQITDTVYFGQHDHPKPQSNLPLAVAFVVPAVEDRSAESFAISAKDKLCNVVVKTPNKMEHPAVVISDVVKSVFSQSNRRRDEMDNNDALDSKRQKKGNLDEDEVDKPISVHRVVVKTVSEVDIVNDGYRWRKYGQKLVKGNSNPRSYYRCSSYGCPAKKHVERASHDPKTVIATYEGQHDHDMPPGRTLTLHTAGHNNLTITRDGETGTKPRENDAICHTNSGFMNKADEQLNGESGSKSQANDSGSHVESIAKSEENDTEGPESRSNDDTKTRSRDGNNVSTPNHQSTSKEQPTSNAEAARNHKLFKQELVKPMHDRKLGANQVVVEKQRAQVCETQSTSSASPPIHDEADGHILEASYKKIYKSQLRGTYVQGLGEHNRRDPKSRWLLGSCSTAASQTSLASQEEVPTLQKNIEEQENQYAQLQQHVDERLAAQARVQEEKHQQKLDAQQRWFETRLAVVENQLAAELKQVTVEHKRVTTEHKRVMAWILQKMDDRPPPPHDK